MTSPSTPCSSGPAPTAASKICAWSPRCCAAQGRRRRADARGARLDAGRAQAESEGLGEIFTAAGAEWRQAGCSMCLGMNPDQLAPGQRCVDVQPQLRRPTGQGRRHLVSPAVAAATAVRGTLSSPADLTR